MSINYSYLEDNGIEFIGTEIVVFKEISDVNSEIYETPQKTKSITYQLWDLTNVQKFDLSSSDMQALAAQDQYAAEQNPGMLIAIVGEQDLIFGLSRMWEAYVDEAPLESHVFRSVKEARNWIREKLHGNKA